ncbi:agamous-like MADS-box protein AGL62 [Humulus lupulus]|uniref:agamous-like MADS-box protein AGL62 n=1 Tax=Humulus lupulus TaxID=3486 RepID=UPI002B40F4A8|nr:agamous-like MADS-box protein AGL62 [Humulus lupulus]
MGKRTLEEGGRGQCCSNVFVSFSKRRKGLFQKASELCTKCGAQIAIVVLSPTGNPFSFGHPSVNEVLGHYLSQTTINTSFVTDEHRHQTQRIEGLKLSLKQVQERESLDEESKIVLGLKECIEKEFEDCKETTSVEDLEGLKQKFVVLVDKITERLLRSGSSSCSFDDDDHHHLFGISLSDLGS